MKLLVTHLSVFLCYPSIIPDILLSTTSIYCRDQRMSGAIPPLPNTPSWCGAQLKHRDNFTFPFTLFSLSIFVLILGRETKFHGHKVTGKITIYPSKFESLCNITPITILPQNLENTLCRLSATHCIYPSI
jgi:hypothetical protein